MAKWKKSPRFTLFILCFGAFLDWISYGLVYPFFATLIFHPNFSFLVSASDAARGVWLGVMIAASPIGQFFSSPIFGAISDQFGRKPTLLATYLIIIFGYFLCALGIWNQNFILLIIGRAVTGIGAGNISIINSAVADISHSEAKAKNFALVAMASGLGFTAGPFIGGLLSRWGFDAPFIYAGLLTFVAFLLFSFLFVETFPTKGNSWSTLKSRLHPFVNFSSLSKFKTFFPAFFIFCFGWSFYWEFIPVTWIKIFHFDVSQIGNFYAYGSAFYVLSSGLLIRPIIKRFKATPILLGAWALLGFCFLLLYHTKVGAYWTFIPIQQFLVALIFPVGAAIVSNTAAKNRQGETLGTFQALQSFAFAITPFLGGILLSLDNGAPLIVGSFAMFLACAIALIGRIPKRDRKNKFI